MSHKLWNQVTWQVEEYFFPAAQVIWASTRQLGWTLPLLGSLAGLLLFLGRILCLRVSLSSSYGLYKPKGEEPNKFGLFQGLPEVIELFISCVIMMQNAVFQFPKEQPVS